MPWISLPTFLLAVHLLANVVWIGAILAAAIVASAAGARAAPESALVGKLARRVYATLAVPAFAVSFVAGLARLLLAPGVYLHMPWMHAKLTLAVGIIAVHHVIGARCRKLGDGKPEAGRGMTGLAIATFAAAAGAVFLGVFKSLP
jgi:protoporphyrinogen IX oxidase